MNRFCVAIAFVACAYGAPAVVGQTHHSYAAGAPVVENRVEYGIVGQRTVQTGVQQVVAGHAYAVAGQETIPQPAHSYVAGEAKNLVETVVQTKIAAPVRTHTRITPQVTNIVPKINVQKYNVDVPVAAAAPVAAVAAAPAVAAPAVAA